MTRTEGLVITGHIPSGPHTPHEKTARTLTCAPLFYDRGQPNFLQAAVATIALSAIALVALIFSIPLLLSRQGRQILLQTVGNFYPNVRHVWLRYLSKELPIISIADKDLSGAHLIINRIKSLDKNEKQQLLSCLKNSTMPTSEEHQELLIDIAKNYEALKEIASTLESKTKTFLEACFNSPMPLFQIVKVIHCKHIDEITNDLEAYQKYPQSKELLGRGVNPHELGSIKKGMEADSENGNLLEWKLACRRNKPFKISQILSRDITRFPTIHMYSLGRLKKQIDPTTISKLSEEFPDLLMGIHQIEFVRQVLNPLFSTLSTFSSLEDEEQIDINLQNSLVQTGPHSLRANAYSLLLEERAKIGMQEKSLVIELHDIANDELHIVYKLQQELNKSTSPIGNLEYQTTVVWKKTNTGEWVDTSCKTDIKTLAFVNTPALYSKDM